ncbi:MAG: hypothetical protein WC906_02470 [Parcubacteria group bacterium]|jgi:hypothetical protein
MIDFISHPLFEKETAKLKRRFSFLDKALEAFKMLCEFQFHPLNPQQRIAPAKLHRIKQNDLWSIWKIELAVPGLRPNQFPRVWFAVKGSSIAFLCIATHVDNYNDNQITQISLGRVSDIF